MYWVLNCCAVEAVQLILHCHKITIEMTNEEMNERLPVRCKGGSACLLEFMLVNPALLRDNDAVN